MKRFVGSTVLHGQSMCWKACYALLYYWRESMRSISRKLSWWQSNFLYDHYHVMRLTIWPLTVNDSSFGRGSHGLEG